ncbi:MAG: hypothetical protein LBS00_09725 [Synergistaceae bacterium]|nr:hypothetical protein [Synergistaceae bacterium]
MKMTVGRLKQLSADERTRMPFETRQLYLMDEAARLEAAVAKTRGRNEGKLEMVKKMLLSGFDIEAIAHISDMSAEEIKKLK